VTIGIEGRRSVEIAGPRLEAVPFTFADPLAVRIAEAKPTAAGFRYDLRYMAYGPGEFDLGDYLVDETNRRPPELAKMPVAVASILPEDHHGELFDSPTLPIDLQTRYWTWMWLTWGAWAVLLLPLVAYGRHRRRQEAPPPPQPTVAERLRSLLELAEGTDLSVQQQADLEKLLLAFWARRLGLTAERLADALEQLRQHPTASTQVQRLERWLHSRTPDARTAVARELLNQLSTEWNSASNGTRAKVNR
jgi:hypothetical protein